MIKQKWAKILGSTILTASMVLSAGGIQNVYAEDETGIIAETDTVDEEVQGTLENTVSGNDTGSYQPKVTKTEDVVKEAGQQADNFVVGTEVTGSLQSKEDVN